jgi:hypothetical protein
MASCKRRGEDTAPWSLDVLRPRRSRTNGAQHTSPGQARVAGAALGSKPKSGSRPIGALGIVHSGGCLGRRRPLAFPCTRSPCHLNPRRSAPHTRPRNPNLNSWPPNVPSAPIGRTAMGRLTQGGAREAGLPWAGIPAHRWCGRGHQTCKPPKLRHVVAPPLPAIAQRRRGGGVVRMRPSFPWSFFRV